MLEWYLQCQRDLPEKVKKDKISKGEKIVNQSISHVQCRLVNVTVTLNKKEKVRKQKIQSLKERNKLRNSQKHIWNFQKAAQSYVL